MKKDRNIKRGAREGVRKKPGNEAILARLRQFRGKLPADFKFDREEANARS